MAQVLIPVRFYGFDSVMYIASAIIGFLISYYAFRLYEITNKKSHSYFYLSFTILSMALLTLGLTSGFTYLNIFSYKQANPSDTIAFVDDFGYWIYYVASLVAYSMLVFSYLPEKWRFPILLPFWYNAFPYFHITSFFLLSYVIFRNIVNFVDRKNLSSFLVMFAFMLMGLYHLLLFFTSFSKLIYVIAHFSLSLGFLSLLLMLIKVTVRKK